MGGGETHDLFHPHGNLIADLHQFSGGINPSPRK
jgi:hypothetical protein